MDEEESSFFFENCGFYQEEGEKIVEVESPVLSPQNQEPLTLKAFNPFEYVEHLPEKEQQKYLNMVMHNKTYPGITHFINFDKTIECPEFLNSIESQSEYNKDWTDNTLHLEELFTNDPETLKRKVEEIKFEINQVNNKAFENLNINHLIMPHFVENFDNFLYLNSHLNFIKDLEVNMLNFADQLKQREKKYDLVVKIYEFWMSTFERFVQCIKKHNERYTLSIVKKLKDGEGSNPSNYEGRSTTSSRMMEVEKRKAWKHSELEMLEKVIQTNSTFNMTTINKIAEELNRTPASVSSKIQKIIKDQKVSNPDYEVHENMTLLEKIVNVLKNYPEGLSRESVIERVNEHYEMGYDMSWSKSVAQILSSKPEFVRIKGTFSLNGQFTFDLRKKTFKDKVVNCLLAIPEGKADLKRIVDQYISIYGTTEGITILSDERRKTIEASISKSLCRYDIFNKNKSKTVYKLREFIDENDCEMDVEGYLA